MDENKLKWEKVLIRGIRSKRILTKSTSRIALLTLLVFWSLSETQEDAGKELLSGLLCFVTACR